MATKAGGKTPDPDALTAAEREINRAAWRTDIRRGGLAYYRAIRGFGIPDLLDKVAKVTVDDRTRPPGVTEGAWNIAIQKKIAPARVFAFPDALVAEPRLIGYYRRLVGASTKAVRNVIGDPRGYETGTRSVLKVSVAQSMSALFNDAVSSLLEEEESFSEEEIPALVGATSGSQIQGSIVTQKGQLAQEMVWQWILSYLASAGHIAKLSPRRGSLPSLSVTDTMEHSKQVRLCELNNGITFAFANEPDIAIHDKVGLLLAVHEVKAGIDLAGAKERYPAAQRSFETARKENPACHTVLVAGCISKAVKRLIREGGWVNRSYLLPELEMNPERKLAYLEAEVRTYAAR